MFGFVITGFFMAADVMYIHVFPASEETKERERESERVWGGIHREGKHPLNQPQVHSLLTLACVTWTSNMVPATHTARSLSNRKANLG